MDEWSNELEEDKDTYYEKQPDVTKLRLQSPSFKQKKGKPMQYDCKNCGKHCGEGYRVTEHWKRTHYRMKGVHACGRRNCTHR